MTKDMTEGHALSLILRFALPLLAGNLLQQGYNVADAAIVGRFLGSKALASVGASGSVQFLVLGFCIGSCTGFCVPIAQRFGAKDYGSMRRYVYNSFWLSGILAVVLTAACSLLCTDIMNILSTPQDIFKDAYIYQLIIFLGIPFTLLYNLFSSVMRAVGDSRTPFLFLAFSTVVNIFLDLFCVTVLHWGCAGAAIATITSQAMSGFLCMIYTMRKYPVLEIRKEERAMDGSYLKDLMWVGFPMGLQFSITAIGSMVMQSANNQLGSLYVSAFTAASRIRMFAMCPFDALAAAVSTFCSQNYGARKVDRIKRGVLQGVVISIIYGVIMGFVQIFFGRALTLLFVSSGETAVLDAAGLCLRTGGWFFPLLGILIVVRLCVQGLGYSGRAVFSGVVEMFTRSIGSIVFVPSFAFLAICYTDPAAWVTAMLYIVPIYLYCIKKIERECGQERPDEIKG